MKFDKKSRLPVSGLIYDIQQALANELGFNIVYVLVPPITPDVNWNVRLMRVLKYVDVYGWTFSDTVARRSIGLGFFDSILGNIDMNYILILI